MTISLYTIGSLLVAAPKGPTDTAQPCEGDVKQTTSLDFIDKKIGPFGAYDIVYYYVATPNDPAKDQRSLLFHYDQPTAAKPTATANLKAARIKIKDPGNQGVVYLFLTDQNGDKAIESVGLAESFDGGRTFVDLGVLYISRIADKQSGEKRINYSANISELKLCGENNRLVGERKLPKDRPQIIDLIRRLDWAWQRDLRP